MKGTKRFALSDSLPDTNDSDFGNKRVMAGSRFDVQRAEPSQQQLMAAPQLDVHRAESSRQHVRALNSQFASWVQTQLKNHPDELWEDGVRDYLAHASNIMEKFSDVVNWLKANAVKGGSLSPAESHAIEKKHVPKIKNNEVKLSQEKTVFTPAGSTSSFAAPWSSGVFSNNQSGAVSNNQSGTFSNNQSGAFSDNQSGVFSNNHSGVFSNSRTPGLFSNSQTPGLFSSSQTSVLFGSQSSVPTNNVSDELDGGDDLPQPSSPSVKKSEEKGTVVVHEVKCKLYVKSSDPADKDTWKDKGTGQLCIKCKAGISKGTKESKPTIVVRNEVGKVLLNALLYPGIKTNAQKNSIIAIFHTSGDDGSNNDSIVARTFLIKTKTEEDRNKLATAIQEYAPAS